MSTADPSNPITSVSAAAPAVNLAPTYQGLLKRLNLDLRGRMFPVERETLMLLPESVLLGLFPQGLILSKPASWEGGDDGVFTVDVGGVVVVADASLTPTASSTFWTFGQRPRLRSMGPQRSRASSTPSSQSPARRRTPTRMSTRTLCSPSRRLSSCARSSSTLASPSLARSHMSTRTE